MMFPSFIRRPSHTVLLAVASALIAGSGLLLWMHATAVRDMREVGLPAALSLPRIEKRMTVLREQNDIAELQATLRGGSQEDILRVYVVPQREEIDRLLASIDVLVSWMEQKKMLSGFSGVKTGEAVESGSGLLAVPVSFQADVTDEGLATIARFAEFSGLMTISDALEQDDIDALLALTENDQPATIAALERFLATDLLRYSEDPASYDTQLLKSFLPSAEAGLRSALAVPRLQRARITLGALAPVLQKQNLWPLRLLTLERAAVTATENGRLRVNFELRAYVRPR